MSNANGVSPDVPVLAPGQTNHDYPVPVYLLNGGGGGTASNFGVPFPSSGTAAGFKDASGNMAGANLDAQGNLKIAGSFSSTPPSSSTANVAAQTSVGTVAGSILAANANRKGCSVKNTGTTVIKLALGQTPSQTVYHISLPAGGAADDGAGGFWDGTISGVVWTGAISAISSGAGGTCVVTELT